MANQYQPADASPASVDPEEKISVGEWLVILTILIAATVGYVYYYSTHTSAVPQSAAAGSSTSAAR